MPAGEMTRSQRSNASAPAWVVVRGDDGLQSVRRIGADRELASRRAGPDVWLQSVRRIGADRELASRRAGPAERGSAQWRRVRVLPDHGAVPRWPTRPRPVGGPCVITTGRQDDGLQSVRRIGADRELASRRAGPDVWLQSVRRIGADRELASRRAGRSPPGPAERGTAGAGTARSRRSPSVADSARARRGPVCGAAPGPASRGGRERCRRRHAESTA